MIAVWKYEFQTTDELLFDIPELAKILTVDMQRSGVPAIWAQVDTNAPTTERKFRVVGTGNELCELYTELDKYVYIGTYQQETPFTTFVWHAYEVLS